MVQVMDEGAEADGASEHVEAWEQNQTNEATQVKHLKLSKFSFGTTKNEQIDYAKLARHRESVRLSQEFQVLEYEPSHLLTAASKLDMLNMTQTKSMRSSTGLDREQDERGSRADVAQGMSETLAAEFKLPLDIAADAGSSAGAPVKSTPGRS